MYSSFACLYIFVLCCFGLCACVLVCCFLVLFFVFVCFFFCFYCLFTLNVLILINAKHSLANATRRLRVITHADHTCAHANLDLLEMGMIVHVTVNILKSR